MCFESCQCSESQLGVGACVCTQPVPRRTERGDCNERGTSHSGAVITPSLSLRANNRQIEAASWSELHEPQHLIELHCWFRSFPSLQWVDSLHVSSQDQKRVIDCAVSRVRNGKLSINVEIGTGWCSLVEVEHKLFGCSRKRGLAAAHRQHNLISVPGTHRTRRRRAELTWSCSCSSTVAYLVSPYAMSGPDTA